MIDAACNYLNPYATASLAATTTQTSGPPIVTTLANGNEFISSVSTTSPYNNKTLVVSSPSSAVSYNPMKVEMQYPPQPSSTGSVSPNSSIQSAPSSASVSPSIFPSPAQSFASISSSPPSSATSASPLSGSHTELGAAAAASAAYSWNTAAYTAALPTRYVSSQISLRMYICMCAHICTQMHWLSLFSVFKKKKNYKKYGKPFSVSYIL